MEKTTRIRRRHGRKFYRWVIEVEVADIWVEDGFDLDDDRCRDMVGRILGYATADEYAARVLRSPDARAIRVEQGGDE